MATVMHACLFIVIALSFQLVTGRGRRICPHVVPANVSVKELVGRYYGQDYWFLEPGPDTDCPTVNFMPLEEDQCGIPIPRHQYYTYFADGSFQLSETILREPGLGLYTQQRVRNLTILYYQNGNLLVNGCREEDSFTRYVLFTKCRNITQEEKDQVYRDATSQIPSRYKLYPATRNGCDESIL